MLVSDTGIREAIRLRDIVIDPFDDSMLQPASYDLEIGKLGATFRDFGADPILNIENDGPLVIQPDAPAVVSTREVIELSTSFAGRLALRLIRVFVVRFG